MSDEQQESYLSIGLRYAEEDHYNEAIKFLTLAIDQGLELNNEILARGERSVCFGRLQNYRDALADTDWLIKRGRIDRYLYRAIMKNCLEDYWGAIADCTRAINTGLSGINVLGVNFSDYLRRGRIYLKVNQYSQAIEDFTISLSLNNIQHNRGTIHEWRGLAYAQSGDYPAALSDFACGRDPKIPPYFQHLDGFYFYRGLALEHTGDLEDAIKDYRRAEIDPTHPEAERIKKLLEQTK